MKRTGRRKRISPVNRTHRIRRNRPAKEDRPARGDRPAKAACRPGKAFPPNCPAGENPGEECPSTFSFWPPVELDQLLAFRDRRQALQRKLLADFGYPLIAFTMNIPGPVKNSPLIELAFSQGMVRLTEELGRPLACRRLREAAGCAAFLVYDRPAAELKALCLRLEDEIPAGRLWDMDVLDSQGEKLTRPQPRRCLLCGEPAFVCSRSRRHPLPQLQERTQSLLTDLAASVLSAAAVNALLWEARLTPKPGLVDRRNNGAHRDMNLALFEVSARSLHDYFALACRLGAARRDCLPQLRRAGLEAEKRMLEATGGVNTHKGAIYSFGIFLAALGSRLLRGSQVFGLAARLAAEQARTAEDEESPPAEAASGITAAKPAAESPEAETAPVITAAKPAAESPAAEAALVPGPASAGGKAPSPASHGRQVYLRYGLGGARQEAMAGFPLARRAWKFLRKAGPRDCGTTLPKDSAGLRAFLEILAVCNDTNLLYRGGEAGLAFAREEARRLLRVPSRRRLALLEALDKEFIRRNLSPGGCADILGLGCFLFLTERIWN